jgi:hypothetical protein
MRINQIQLSECQPVLRPTESGSRYKDFHGGTLAFMSEEKQFAVIHSPQLESPSSLELPPRFRLSVAANVSNISTDMMSDFALAGMTLESAKFFV